MASVRARFWFLLIVPLTVSVSCGLISQDDGEGSGGSNVADEGATGGVSVGGLRGNGTGGVASIAGAGGTPSYGGSSSGGACTTDDRALFDCPDLCTALAELNCDVRRSRSIYHLRGSEGVPVIAYYVHEGYEDCFYDEGELVGAALHDFDTYRYCDGASKSLTWGREPPPLDDTAVAPKACDALGFGGAFSDGPAQCYSTGWNQCGNCCPETPPDCSGEPHVSFQCNTADCDCQCLGGQWSCDCL